MPPLLIVAALRQARAGVGAGNVSMKVGGVVSQQAPADQLLLLPQIQQARLRFFQGVALLVLGRGLFLRQELLKAIPKGLRGKVLWFRALEGILEMLDENVGPATVKHPTLASDSD